MNDDRIDLSALDPACDKQRWDRLVHSVASRAWTARQRRLTVAFQLIAWTRPVLAIAAGLALVTWAGALTFGADLKQGRVAQQEPVAALAQWAAADELPSTSQILQVLGEGHGTE